MMSAGAQLMELDLSDNAFGPNGMVGLTDFLKSSSCYALRELRLNNNGLGITGGKVCYIISMIFYFQLFIILATFGESGFNSGRIILLFGRPDLFYASLSCSI